MEPSALFVFGPPSKGCAGRDLFDQYQNNRNTNTPLGPKNWADFEKIVVDNLFRHVDGAPSEFEDLYSKMFSASIRVDDYYFSMGNHRGLWVACITLARSSVSAQAGTSVPWPPSDEQRRRIMLALQYILKRQWVGGFSLESMKDPGVDFEWCGHHMPTEQNISWSRFAGAVIFGFGSMCAISVAFDQIPQIISQAAGMDAAKVYESSYLFKFITNAFVPFSAAMIAGLLARQKGALAGILAVCPLVLLMLGLLYSSKQAGSQGIYILAAVLVSGLLGGILGHKIYSPAYDLDIQSERHTWFGIRWFHYFWIMPLAAAFLVTALNALYLGILTTWASLYYLTHPGLWIRLSWAAFSLIMATLESAIITIMIVSFSRFYETVRFHREHSSRLKEIGKVLLYGLLAPLLAGALAASGSKATMNLLSASRNDPGNWKIGLIATLLFPTALMLVIIYQALSNRRITTKSGSA